MTLTPDDDRMIGFNGWLIRRAGVDARHSDGRPQKQIAACIQASSQRACAQAIGESTYFVSTYWSKALSHGMRTALAQHPPGTVLVAPMDPRGTINGTTGWRPL